METAILICLLLAIYLLLEDKIQSKKLVRHYSQEEPAPKELDVMGTATPAVSQSGTTPVKQSQSSESEDLDDIFDLEIDEEDVVQIAQEELGRKVSNGPDLLEEEEEWNSYQISEADNGFTSGVTFEELSTVGMLLAQDVLEASQKQTAVKIVQKIQGTELFSLLESSMAGASERIAKLVDSSLQTGADSGSSFMQGRDVDGFDIGEFV
jgi:hypothetical protein